MKKNYYTVYLNSTDEIIAVGDATQCTKQLNRSSEASFYCLVYRCQKGQVKKYTVLTEPICDTSDEGANQ